MAAISDLSIEFAHVSLPDLDERRAERAAHVAKQWAMPTVEAYEQAGLTVSTVVMLDDYFVPTGTDVAKRRQLLLQACEAAAVRVDHVALEADCAESVPLMRAHLSPRPLRNQAPRSRAPQAVGSEWLDNGDPPRAEQAESDANAARTSPDDDGSTRVRGPLRLPRGRHAIHLDVELCDEHLDSGARVWACPTLSAWWQLIRLGMLDDESGTSLAPPRTQSRTGAPPLPARRTLTLLDPRFLEVEHAARVILERVNLPEAWRHRLREGNQAVDSHEHLKRIAYMFILAGFDLRRATTQPAASRPRTKTIPS